MKRIMLKIRIVSFAVPLVLVMSFSSFAADYYVDAFNGSDSSGTGGSQNPWQSITYALTQVGSGDTIYAAPGTYSQSIGEDFPIQMKSGVDLIGADPNCTYLFRDTNLPSTGGDVVRVADNCTLTGFYLTGADPVDWYAGLVAGWHTGNNFTLHDCILSGDRRSVILYNQGNPQDSVHIYQCLVLGATADSFSFWDVTNLRVINNTIDGKGVARSGIMADNCTGQIENNIIVNHGFAGIEFGQNPAGLFVSCNDVWGNQSNYRNGPTPPGDIQMDPQLLAPSHGDYHLKLLSPCVDSGDNNAYNLPQYDFEGDTRIVDGDWTTGAVVDIGYDELLPEVAARFGNVNEAAGWVKDVLRINTSPGDKHRVFQTAVKTPVVIDIQAPFGGPSPSKFVLYIFPIEPQRQHITPQPLGLGFSAFPTVLSGGLPRPVTLCNSLGNEQYLGYPMIPGIPPAPTTILNLWFGIPQPVTCCFQGIMEDNNASGPGHSITNAIVLKVL